MTEMIVIIMKFLKQPPGNRSCGKVRAVLAAFAMLFWASACSTVPVKTPEQGTRIQTSSPTGQDYTIQVGAFGGESQANRYIRHLKSRDVEAFAVLNEKGLWTVRTGHFPSVSQARARAALLNKQKKINDFFIVNARQKEKGSDSPHLDLEDRILKTARGYLGVRYKWGGTSAKAGFDCSGFTLTVFRQHGISLPRSSSDQFQIGHPVTKKDLKKGDLVFFATGFGNRVSHVGIYSGKGRFIHASTSDKCIRTADMTKRYYRKRYRGARRVVHLGAG